MDSPITIATEITPPWLPLESLETDDQNRLTVRGSALPLKVARRLATWAYQNFGRDEYDEILKAILSNKFAIKSTHFVETRIARRLAVELPEDIIGN